MKRLLFILGIAALVIPATALGKGPSGASIDGPGGGGGITFTGNGESGGTPLGDLTEQAGFFPAVFHEDPGSMLPSRPEGDLGPKYTITYTVPGPEGESDKVRQDVYPYAKPAPVTYMAPGQRIYGTEQTDGGWFQADAELNRTLVSAGLPLKGAAAAAARAPVSPEDSAFPTPLVGLLAAGLVLAAATAIFLRRRVRSAPAA